MFDQVTGSDSNLNAVCQEWCANWMGTEGMNYNEQGELTSVVAYYDPELDHKQYFGSKERGAGMGLGIAWYLLPQGGVAADLAVAHEHNHRTPSTEELYQAVVCIDLG